VAEWRCAPAIEEAKVTLTQNAKGRALRIGVAVARRASLTPVTPVTPSITSIQFPDRSVVIFVLVDGAEPAPEFANPSIAGQAGQFD
jgi:hypothetical protein